MLKKSQIQNLQSGRSTVRIELEQDRRCRKIGSESRNRGMIFGKSHILDIQFYLRSTIRKNPEMKSTTQDDFRNRDCGRT